MTEQENKTELAPEALHSTQSKHRLPTVSAADALLEFENGNTSIVSLGLATLDTMFSDGSATPPRLMPGKITELWGPSGSGKTGLMLQAVRNTIRDGKHAVWIDGKAPVNMRRVRQLLKDEVEDEPDEHLARFHHAHVADLSHLLALIMHSRSGFPPKHTSLIVLDDLHSLLDVDYPRFFANAGLKGEQAKWRAGRRYALLGSIVVALNRLAALNNVVILVSTGAASRMRANSGLGAAMVPGVGGPEWEAGIWNRLCLLRDFDYRIIGLQKCRGKSLTSRTEVPEAGKVIAVDLSRQGLFTESPAPTERLNIAPSRPPATQTRKRMFGEIADSEGENDEDYSWVEAENEIISGEIADPPVNDLVAGKEALEA